MEIYFNKPSPFFVGAVSDLKSFSIKVSAGKVGGKVSAKGGVLKGRTSQACRCHELWWIKLVGHPVEAATVPYYWDYTPAK